MNKREFLDELNKRLSKISKSEREKSISYYDEIIQDMIDSGMDEKEAVKQQGEIDDIVESIFGELGVENSGLRFMPILSVILLVVVIIGFMAFSSIKQKNKYRDLATKEELTTENIIAETTQADIKVLDKSEYDEEAVKNRIETVIKLFAEEKYSEIKNNYAAPVMKPYFEDSEMEKCRQLISSNWGKVGNIGTVYSDMVEQDDVKYIISQTNASFDNISVTFTITLNEELLIEGFYIK